MARKPTDFAVVDLAWGFYLKDRSPKSIALQCLAAGHKVHVNTISRWINQGIPTADIEPFKHRIQRIEQAAEVLFAERKRKEAEERDRRAAEQAAKQARQPPPPAPPTDPARGIPVTAATQVEIVRSQTVAQHAESSSMVDQIIAQYAVAQIEDWGQELGRTLAIARMANDLVMECLMGADPEDHVAVRNATGALKNTVSAIRGAIESQQVLNGILNIGDDGDKRDRWVQDNFKGWTAEEHRAFRDRGEWPARLGPPPDFILSGGASQEGE